RSRSTRSYRGLPIFSPVDRVSRLLRPTSMPTAAVVAGAAAITSSHNSDRNHRPARSWETVTVDGEVPSGSGRDHTMLRGSVIFAKVSWPSRQRNALAVYSADRRDLFLLLNVGYPARLAKKFVNAICK